MAQPSSRTTPDLTHNPLVTGIRPFDGGPLLIILVNGTDLWRQPQRLREFTVCGEVAHRLDCVLADYRPLQARVKHTRVKHTDVTKTNSLSIQSILVTPSNRISFVLEATSPGRETRLMRLETEIEYWNCARGAFQSCAAGESRITHVPSTEFCPDRPG